MADRATLVLRIVAIAATVLAASLTAPGCAQEFSAALVTQPRAGSAGEPAGKMFVSQGKVRIESPEAGGFFLIDRTAGTAYLARPPQRIFMQAGTSSRLAQVFVSIDPADPCQSWRAAAAMTNVTVDDGRWQCEADGREALDGRETLRYRLTFPGYPAIQVWVDSDLRFPVRMQTTDRTVALADPRLGPVPAQMFVLPAHFRQFDPQMLVERVKQSDVWVELPHEE